MVANGSYVLSLLGIYEQMIGMTKADDLFDVCLHDCKFRAHVSRNASYSAGVRACCGPQFNISQRFLKNARAIAWSHATVSRILFSYHKRFVCVKCSLYEHVCSRRRARKARGLFRLCYQFGQILSYHFLLFAPNGIFMTTRSCLLSFSTHATFFFSSNVMKL